MGLFLGQKMWGGNTPASVTSGVHVLTTSCYG